MNKAVILRGKDITHLVRNIFYPDHKEDYRGIVNPLRRPLIVDIKIEYHSGEYEFVDSDVLEVRNENGTTYTYNP